MPHPSAQQQWPQADHGRMPRRLLGMDRAGGVLHQKVNKRPHSLAGGLESTVAGERQTPHGGSDRLDRKSAVSRAWRDYEVEDILVKQPDALGLGPNPSRDQPALAIAAGGDLVQACTACRSRGGWSSRQASADDWGTSWACQWPPSMLVDCESAVSRAWRDNEDIRQTTRRRVGIWGSGRIPDRRAFRTPGRVVPSHPL